MAKQPDAEQQTQSWEVADCFFELIGKIIGEAEQLAQRLGVPVPFIKALHSMDCPLAMKELGRRMHCDPSFVTLVADMMEKRGLARREPHAADRRVKNLVLTDEGLALKHAIETELTARMPWNRALDGDERSRLLALIRKMLSTDADGDPATGAVTPDAMHGPLATLLVTALKDSAPHEQPPPKPDARPATATGEVTRAVSGTPTAR
ncbi:MAG TPA: MarR family transcriptional regulator [Streptosporangiaceae bacterium]|nr:MarR family transcriptional regulator [Streptosporangiaceae bacterium]